MDNNLKQEVMYLLPWYHLGKLTDEEKKIVEEALANDPSLEEAAAAEQNMMSHVQADKSLMDGSIFADPTSRLDNVLAKLDGLEPKAAPVEAESKRKAVTQPKTNVFTQIKEYFDSLLQGSSRSFTYAVFAALTVVQLALLVLFIVPSDNIGHGESSSYELSGFDGQSAPAQQPAAPATPSSASQMVLLIGMNTHFKAEGFDEIVGSDVEVTLLPDSYGYYRVRINKKLSEQEIEDLKNELSKKHGKIWFIGEESPQ